MVCSLIPIWGRISRLSLVFCSVGVLVACQRSTQFSPSTQISPPEQPFPETRLIPERSLLSVSMVTDPQKLTGGAPPEIAAWQRDMEEDTGLNWAQDVQPWIGETLTVAVVEPDLVPQREQSVAGVLLTAQTQDPQASTVALEQLRDQQMEETGSEFEERHQGQVRLLIELEADSGEQMVLATFGDRYVALANDLTVMEEAIATFNQTEQASALRQDPAFTSALEDLWQSEALMFAYLNPGLLWADPELAAAYDLDLTAEDLAMLQGLRGLSVISQWQPEGLLVRGQADVDPESLWGSVAAGTVPGEVVQRLPGEALVVITGHGLAQSWQRNLDQLAADPEAMEGLQMVRQLFAATTQLDLDQDLIGWMDGEFAAVMVPDSTHCQQCPFGGMLALQTSQQEQAQASLEQIDQFVQGYGVQVEQDADQVIWKDPFFGQPLIHRSWLADFLVIGSNDEAQATFAGEGGTPLPEVEPFKSLYESLPQPNYGYVMVNGQGLLELVEETQPEAFATADPETREALELFTGLGITSYPWDEDSYRMDLLLTVQSETSGAEN